MKLDFIFDILLLFITQILKKEILISHFFMNLIGFK